MKTSFHTRRSWRRLLVCIAAAAVAAGCGSSTTSSSSSARSGGSSSTAATSSSQAGGRSYDLPSTVRALKIESEAATVRVTASHGSSQIHVVERPNGNASSNHNVAGSSATIASHCPGGINFSNCHMNYELTMPASIALNVTGAAGQVNLQGGPTNAHIKTTAGEVSGSQLGHGSYTVATEAGKVDLSFASAPTLVKANTTAGEIQVTVPGNASYRVKASAHVGEEEIAVPNDPTAANILDLSAEAGSVSVRKR